MFPLSMAILLLVFALIATGRVGRLRLQIWQAMAAGAVIALATGQISLADALASVNLDILLFLFGMFIIGRALDLSGYLSHISHRVFSSARNVDHLVLILLFGGGLASVFLMKDSLVVIATPALLLHAEKRRIPYKPLLLALAFGVTIGSVMSPIGNPQNLLIALNGGVQRPFVTFLRYLAAPSLVCLAAAYLVLRFAYRKSFQRSESDASEESIKDAGLATLSKASLGLLLCLSALEVALFLFSPSYELKLPYLSLIAALPIILFSPRRVEVARGVDWGTLVFFASMFILMASVWESGFFQSLIDGSASVSSPGVIFGVSVVASQFISNIPLVALYLPLLTGAGAPVRALMALAAGSTIAGNVSILGAASNIIIMDIAEERYKKRIGFWEFARVGVPLTLICVAVYWLFLYAL